jgi:arsenite-transporting ATPase
VGELSFFLGKGGVGKTTVSAAFATQKSLQNPEASVLLLSSDPAHSLSDIFEKQLRDHPMLVRLGGRAKLYVWQVNAERQFRSFFNKYKSQMLNILEAGSILSREEVEPLLDSTIPGIAEVSALLAVNNALASGDYDFIVVDTAPVGHTLRLLALPKQFSRFVEFLELAASRDQVLAHHFGGKGDVVGARLLSDWRGIVGALQNAIAKDATLFLVTTPETFALQESLRAKTALLAHSPPLKFGAIVLNRALVRADSCKFCKKREQATKAARSLLAQKFPKLKLYIGEDSGAPIVGIQGLRHFAQHLFSGKRLNWKPPAPKVKFQELKRATWPVLDTPLSLVLGKGGVGKTTISAALGFYTRSKTETAVEICSVDPAPSLDDIFQSKIGDEPRPVLGDPKFRASEMDSLATYQNWSARIKDAVEQSMSSDGPIHVDLWFERQLFSKLLDSVPPGLDEVLAAFRIVDLLAQRSNKVVIDMAPTGHALELLRTPDRILAWTRLLLKTLAQHRTLTVAQDAGVKIAQLGHRVREFLDLLKTAEHTCIYTVMLAESLPDHETERLMSDLQDLGLSSRILFVNRVIFKKDAGKCQRCRRANEWQMPTLSKLRQKYKDCIVYVVRNFPKEIAGKQGLRSFTGELWRLV